MIDMSLVYSLEVKIAWGLKSFRRGPKSMQLKIEHCIS